MPVCLAAAVFVLVGALAFPAGAAIVSGQVDDFESGDLLDWSAGFRNPNPPVNTVSGGPAGPGDNYLRLRSNGSGAGGRLVVFNEEHQWAGDYLAAGVTSIRMQVNNLGTTDLVLRLILERGVESLTTLSGVNVAAGSGWRSVSFSLESANLRGDYAFVMANVRALNLVHSPDVVSSRPEAPDIVAQLGIDNVTAVPEPSTLLLTALGFAMTACCAVRKLRRPA
jgi:hypothetical protein